MTVPEREAPVFGATDIETLPFPEPLLPLEMVIHETLAEDVQLQPAVVFTVADALPPLLPIDVEGPVTANEQGTIENPAEFEMLPEPGFRTETGMVPTDCISAAEICAFATLPLMTFVGRVCPFQRTTESGMKLLPLTVSSNAEPPTVAVAGLMPETTGGTKPPEEVMSRDQPPLIVPELPAKKSITNNCQTPFGSLPLNTPLSVAVPAGAGWLYSGAGAGDRKVSSFPTLDGLMVELFVGKGPELAIISAPWSSKV